MKLEKIHKNVNPENLSAVELYLIGFSVTEISRMQKRSVGAISSAICRAKKQSSNDIKYQKKYNFASERTKFAIKTGALIPTISKDLSTDVQKWILEKTLEGNYENIASFFTDLVAEAYFADQ